MTANEDIAEQDEKLVAYAAELQWAKTEISNLMSQLEAAKIPISNLPRQHKVRSYNRLTRSNVSGNSKQILISCTSH